MKTIEETAKELAQRYATDFGGEYLTSVWWEPNDNEVRLIEVNEGAPSIDAIFPFNYEPDPENGIDYKVVVVLASGDEWDKVQTGEIALPDGWNKDTLQCVYERQISWEEARIIVLEKELTELKSKVAKESKTNDEQHY